MGLEQKVSVNFAKIGWPFVWCMGVSQIIWSLQPVEPPHQTYQTYHHTDTTEGWPSVWTSNGEPLWWRWGCWSLVAHNPDFFSNLVNICDLALVSWIPTVDPSNFWEASPSMIRDYFNLYTEMMCLIHSCLLLIDTSHLSFSSYITGTRQTRQLQNSTLKVDGSTTKQSPLVRVYA